MKLYTCRDALSARRVALYLAEKKLSLPTVEVDLAGGEHRRPAFLMLVPLYTIFKHTHPSYADKLEQAPAVAASRRAAFYEHAAAIDRWLGERRFVADETLTLADLTLLIAVDICAAIGCAIDGAALPHLARWTQMMHARPGVNRGWP